MRFFFESCKAKHFQVYRLPPRFSTPTPRYFGMTNEHLLLEDPRFIKQIVAGTRLQTAVLSSILEPSVQA